MGAQYSIAPIPPLWGGHIILPVELQTFRSYGAGTEQLDQPNLFPALAQIDNVGSRLAESFATRNRLLYSLGNTHST